MAAAGRGKNQRRDKGVRRITAFMLWAKHVRKDVAEANPRSFYFVTILPRPRINLY